MRPLGNPPTAEASRAGPRLASADISNCTRTPTAGITYDLHNLDWPCLMIAREVQGQAVESFLDSGDGGGDSACTGNWKQMGQADLTGNPG